MQINIIIEEEIEIMFDQGNKDIILIIRQANDISLPAFILNLHMDGVIFSKLLKEMNEFAKGE